MKEKFALPDLICVERDMQSMNGLEFLRLCKENDRLKNVPVIVHAASLTKLEVDELRSSGALAVFTRPYDFYSVCTMLGIYFGIEPISISQN